MFTEDRPYLDLTSECHPDLLRLHSEEILAGIARAHVVPALVTHTWNEEYSRAPYENFAEEVSPLYRSLRGDDMISMRQAAVFAGLLSGLHGRVCHYSGSQLVMVRNLKPGFHFTDIRDADKTEPGLDYHLFEDNLMKWVKHLPFEEVGRVTLFVNCTGCGTPLHRDGNKPVPHRNEFVWASIMNKRLIVGMKNPTRSPEGQIVMFDDMNWHGTDPFPGAAVSVRVDGKFTPQLRNVKRLDRYESYLTPDITT